MTHTWVRAKICAHCGEAEHVYFCLHDPRYLADPVGFPLAVEREKLWTTFMANGGRGVELADKIDKLDRKIKRMENTKKEKP